MVSGTHFRSRSLQRHETLVGAAQSAEESEISRWPQIPAYGAGTVTTSELRRRTTGGCPIRGAGHGISGRGAGRANPKQEVRTNAIKRAAGPSANPPVKANMTITPTPGPGVRSFKFAGPRGRVHSSRRRVGIEGRNALNNSAAPNRSRSD